MVREPEWQFTAIVGQLVLQVSQQPTDALMHGLDTLCRVTVDPDNGFERVYTALEHVLTARGCGRELVPEEWR